MLLSLFSYGYSNAFSSFLQEKIPHTDTKKDRPQAAFFVISFPQFICLRRLRFTVPSVMEFGESRLLPVPSTTQEMASSATVV